MTDYGYVDVGKLADYANNTIGGLTANDIMRFPRADVQSVKHGYWKEEEPRVLKCSVCGEYAPMNYLGQNCIDSRYCPWCGTKMDSNADEPWQSE